MTTIEEKKSPSCKGQLDKKFLVTIMVVVCCTIINIMCVFSTACNCADRERYRQDIGSPVTIKEVHDTVYVEVKAQEDAVDSLQKEEPVVLDENGNPMPKDVQETE